MQELTIIAKDQPGVLKDITAAIFDAGLNINSLHNDALNDGSGNAKTVVSTNGDLGPVTEKLKALPAVVEVM